MTSVKLEVYNKAYTRHESSDEPYGDWSRDTDNDVQNLTIAKDCWDVIADFDVEVGDKLYLVWCEYGEGDSFGSSSGETEFIAVYKTKEKADACHKACKNTESGILTYVTETGDSVEIYTPWHGYFEVLEEVHTTLLEVE